MSRRNNILAKGEHVPIARLKQNLAWGEHNRYITVYNDDVRFPDRSEGQYLRIVEGKGKPGVVVVPITSAGDFLLVNLFRYPISSWSLEFPRGFGECESSVDDAERECQEELGREVDQLHFLGSLYVNSGLLATKVDVFGALVSAREVERDQEVDSVHELTVEALQEKIQKNEITDSVTVSAYHLALSSDWVMRSRGYLPQS